MERKLLIHRLDQDEPLLKLFSSGPDWILWSPAEGYYASSPGGERLMGWTFVNGPNRVATFYPAERFRKVLYRPDVIRLVLEKGTVAEALKEANARAGVKETKPAEVAELLPPSVTLELVGPPGETVTLQVSARAAVKGQPVEALRLLLDGRPFPDGQFQQKFAGTPAADARWEVTVPPGRHELKVLARGPDTSDISNALVVTTDVPAGGKPALFCLPVGLNYDGDPKLAGLKLEAAENDARDLLAALKASCAGPGNRFREVVGEPLLGKDATAGAILDALKGVRKRGAKPGDLVVVFFAGHGVAEGGEFYLLPADVDPAAIPKTSLSGKAVHAALREMPCGVLLVFDACHSGAALGRFAPAGDAVGRSLADDDAAVTVLAAALPHEHALEEGGHGLLTKALAEALRGGPGSFFDADEGVMNVNHVQARVFDLVNKGSKGRQHPALLAPWTVPPLVLRQAP